jgi:protein-tyrosine kinase
MSLVERTLNKLRSATVADPTRLAESNSEPSPVPAVARVSTESPSKAYGGRARPARVVAVDRDALRAAGFLPPPLQSTQLAWQYRQIKRPLVANALASTDNASCMHVIMVTSAVPGDGKTFTSINLAVSMSREQDINVLLVDADIEKPHISRLFGVSEEPGLLDAVRDDSLDIESLIIGTDFPGLSILPAGRYSEQATELLASQRMMSCMQQLERSDASRVAVLDSPPLLATNESRVIARSVGQIIVVVRDGKTTEHELREALAFLPEGKFVGLVLNQSESMVTHYYQMDGTGNGEA